MSIYNITSLEQTHDLAVKLAKTLSPGDVIAYKGDLGAGKTTFTRGLVEGLGIDAHVSSPTFAIVNQYSSHGKTLYHFDMYRITSFEDLESTGYFDYLDGNSILAIEWSENITDELPENAITISIETSQINPDHRKITITGGKI